MEDDGTKGLRKFLTTRRVKKNDGSLAHPMKKTWYDACVVDTVGETPSRTRRARPSTSSSS